MKCEDDLKNFTEEVNTEIIKILDDWKKEVESINPTLLPFVTSFIEACEGGKRIRGFLVKTGHELATSENNKDIITVAAAVEIMHTAILIHDDIIDKSPLRRGKKTLYKALGDNHFGISQAISLGDTGFFLAIQLLAQSSFSAEKKTVAIQQFVESMKLTTLGEILDVAFSEKDVVKNEADVIAMHLLKTAQYTFVSPLQIGAILGGAKKETLDMIQVFGENIGIAFQIKDDILGVFGDEKRLGKSIYSDVAEGKQTLLISYALDQATAKQKKLLEKYYGYSALDADQFACVKDIFIATGALSYSEKKILAYSDAAKKVIPQITQIEKMRELFAELLTFVIERNT